MTFRIVALALPAAAAFLAPALWQWKPGWKAATSGVGGLIVLVAVWGLIAGASMAAVVATSLVSISLALLALGLHLVAGQVVSGLVVVLLGATVFFAPPAVDDAVRNGGKAQERVDLLLSVSPWATLAAGPFGMDIFRELPSMYRAHTADYTEARPPAWGVVAAGYAIGGLLLMGAAWGARRLRKPA